MPVLLSVLVCTLLAGCVRKKPVLVMPQEPPPATAPTPAPAPQAQQQPAPAQPSPEQGPAQNETAQKNNTKPKPHPAARKPSPQVPAAGEKNGGETTARVSKPKVIQNEPVPVASAPSPELVSQQAATEQLLQSTENAIKGITRQLSPEEQAMLTQIRDFVKQSRDATRENDFGRAHNLAIKAHLLSGELVKQK